MGTVGGKERIWRRDDPTGRNWHAKYRLVDN